MLRVKEFVFDFSQAAKPLHAAKQLLLALRALFKPSEMFSSPPADLFQYWNQRQAIFRDGVAHAWRDTPLFMSQDNSVQYQFLQMPDQHPFCNSGNAAAQFAGSHRAIQ